MASSSAMPMDLSTPSDVHTITMSLSDKHLPVQPHVFKAIQTLDTTALRQCTEEHLRPILPSLVRMALCPALDSSEAGKAKRKNVLSVLLKLEAVNGIVDMLSSIDFHALEQDVRKEQQLRSKLGANMTESVLVSQLQHGLALEFERSQSHSAQRMRLLLSEILFIMSELKDQKAGNFHKQSDLFETNIYLEEILDVLCIAVAELPHLLNLVDVAETLLCLDNGPTLLCQLLGNFPESFLQVCESLIVRGEKLEEDCVGGRRRFELLHMLCEMNQKAALTLRAYCVEQCTLPGFAISVSLQQSPISPKEGERNESDIVPFLTSILLGSDVNTRNWLSSYIKSGQKRKPEWPSLVQLREHLLADLIRLTPPNGESLDLNKTVDASALLRLYSALKAIATIKYTEDELAALFQLVISRPHLTASGSHFISLAISLLIASPGLLRGLEDEQQAVSWLRWIMSSEESFHKQSNQSDSPGELLFLLALHFHNNQMSAVTELVCNTLGMKCTVKASALLKIRQIFTMELFTEQVVAAHAIKLPITPNMDMKSTGYLPVHTILQLLKSRAFSKHKVTVKKWVCGQIKASRFPLHPLLPQLIEAYVNSVIPKTVKPEHTNEPISDDEILSLFPSSVSPMSTAADSSEDMEEENQLCPQLLMLYYLLLYEDLYQTHKKLIDIRKLQPYGERVMSEIPISLLVQEALKQKNNCQNLFPTMIRLLNTHLPHLCLVEDWLDMHVELMGSQPASLASIDQSRLRAKLNPEAISKALSNALNQPSSAIRVLENILAQNDIDTLRSSQDAIVTAVPILLSPSVPRRLQDVLKRVWFRLHAVIPRRLRVSTVNALHGFGTIAFKTMPLLEQDLVTDPLVVLRCDARVFRCPPVLDIVLRILSAYTQACRVFLNSHLLDVASTEKEKDRQELKIALLAAQESAIVQILLEICLQTDEEEKKCHSQMNELREVRCIVFSYIHQVFIADPNLAKLVHFQGYPSQLIPLVVSGVPSMHICLDFIPELLGQPQRSKQIFGIQLLGQLCCQFHIPKAMHMAKLGTDVMFTLLSVLETDEWVFFFSQTVPSLVFMCQAFPPLCDDACSLLSQLGRVCYAHMTVEGNAAKSGSNLKTLNQSSEDLKISPTTDAKLYENLYQNIQLTFNQMCDRALVLANLY